MKKMLIGIPLLPLIIIGLFVFMAFITEAQEPTETEPEPTKQPLKVERTEPMKPSEEDMARARKILDEVDDIYRGKSSQAVFTMEIQTKHWKRSLKMEGWSLGKDYSLMHILEPKKERGTATLKAENNIFNYMSKTDRTIKITSGLMMGSWMGSHFTNDDLIKESRMVNDYFIHISFEGDRDDVKIWEFTLTPKPDAPVVWGKIVAHIRQDDRMPIKYDYFDEDGKLVRVMSFSDYQQMSGRFMPTVMTVIPTDKPEEYTKVTYVEIKFDVDLEKSFFSLQNLKRR